MKYSIFFLDFCMLYFAASSDHTAITRQIRGVKRYCGCCGDWETTQKYGHLFIILLGKLKSVLGEFCVCKLKGNASSSLILTCFDSISMPKISFT